MDRKSQFQFISWENNHGVNRILSGVDPKLKVGSQFTHLIYKVEYIIGVICLWWCVGNPTMTNGAFASERQFMQENGGCESLTRLSSHELPTPVLIIHETIATHVSTFFFNEN